MPETLPDRTTGFTTETRFVVLTREARLALRGEASALAVYCAMLDRVAGTEGTIFPTYDRIAEDAGVSRRAVSTALAVLEKLGLVDRSPRKGQNGQTSNLYTVRALSTGVQNLHSPAGKICPHPQAEFAREEEVMIEEEPEPAGVADSAPTPTSRAWAIQKVVHKQRASPPRDSKLTMEIALRWINAGFEEAVIEAAMVSANVCTHGGVELAMARNHPPAPRYVVETKTIDGRECWFSPGSGWIAIA